MIGKLCDECAENYWNLESGKGCMQCDCDISGTVAASTSCDQHTGQCNCIAGRGGRTCRDCPFGYWGSPRTGCRSMFILFIVVMKLSINIFSFILS